MHKKSSQNIGLMFPGFEMLETVELQTLRALISSAAVSPAKILAMQEKVLDLEAHDQGFGANTRALFANFDPDTSSWKTLQLSLTEEWAQYSEPWPRSGTMQNGIAYQQQPLVRPIDVIDSFLWPTPRASMSRYVGQRKNAIKRLHKIRLEDWCLASESKNRGVPNPNFVEWLMGFPQNWTDLED